MTDEDLKSGDEGQNKKEPVTNDQDAGQESSDSNAEEQDVQILLEDARSKADQHFDQLVRLQAEMDNLRKRTKRDLEAAHKFALEKICQELLPVRDSMEMGMAAAEDESADIETIRQGVDLTLKMFVSVMEKFAIKDVNPEKGDKLNPEFHQAMSMQEDAEVEPNTILTVVQKGYTLNGRLVRPAMVIVAKAASTATDDPKIGSEIDEQA